MECRLHNYCLILISIIAFGYSDEPQIIYDTYIENECRVEIINNVSAMSVTKQFYLGDISSLILRQVTATTSGRRSDTLSALRSVNAENSSVFAAAKNLYGILSFDNTSSESLLNFAQARELTNFSVPEYVANEAIAYENSTASLKLLERGILINPTR